MSFLVLTTTACNFSSFNAGLIVTSFDFIDLSFPKSDGDSIQTNNSSNILSNSC